MPPSNLRRIYRLRLPRGFGKKGYFRLASIQASTIEYKTQCLHTRLLHTTLHATKSSHEEELEDDPPPLLSCPLGFIARRSRPCVCSRLFASRAHSAIKHAQKRRKCNCNCRYFSFRRTGTHPPKFFFLHPDFHPMCPYGLYVLTVKRNFKNVTNLCHWLSSHWRKA